MNHSMDLREVRAFLTLERTRNIAGAAKDLNLGQQDLSRLLRRLEEKLGSRLFVRHGLGVELTSAGALMVANAGRVLSLLHEVAVEIDASVETLRLLMVPPSRRSSVAPRGQYTPAAGARL